MTTRWHLHRAGLLNFWDYDEADFRFSNGRLILRGSNGSGKSVTMQSFIPLVLDGDKRPWRLDPFGSRDRKIEYYLLGDGEHHDRTAYLWLEFRLPQPERFLTVGIGLRGRQTSQTTAFWGFSLEDNRRIGYDFSLYRLDYSGEKEIKIPLSRAQLEQAIGQGGRVVTNTGDYRRLVNQLLFGFEDDAAYQELLDLLIQVRSPKLSKDFKPTTIYDILTSALPALEENDLRPLSEVLEDMDEISDRLDELRHHRKETEKLAEAYRQYNEFQLYTAASTVTSAHQEWMQQRERLHQCEQRLNDIVNRKEELEQEDHAERERLQQLERDEEVLTHHEALGKETELKRLKADHDKTGKQLIQTEKRRERNRKLHDDAEVRREQAAQQVKEQEKAQTECIDELNELAGETSFPYSSSYHYLWARDIPERTSVHWTSWQNDIAEYERIVLKAWQMAGDVAQQENEVKRLERELGEASRHRDERERFVSKKEKALEEGLEKYQNWLFEWRQTLEQLELKDTQFTDLLHRLSQYPDLPYDEVRAPMIAAYEQTLDRLSKEKAELETELEGHRKHYEELQQEWLEWRNLREPEPPVSEARKHSRLRRAAAGEGGAPLYVVCDFQPHVTEAERAQLEEVLERTGLLNAWIATDGAVRLTEEEEEVWFSAEPQFMAHTLADWLTPTPTAESRLRSEQIDDVLRTIVIGTNETVSSGVSVDLDGSFVLGPLMGQTASKSNAEYIGKATRERTRQRELDRLQAEMDHIHNNIHTCEQQLTQSAAARQKLEAEREAFPAGTELETAAHAWQDARRALTFAQEQVKNADERYQQAMQTLRHLRAKLLEQVREHKLPTQERELAHIRHQLRQYERTVNELKSQWETYWHEQDKYERAKAEAEEYTMQLEECEEEWISLKGEWNALAHEIATITELLSELGLLEVHEKLDKLRREKVELKESLNQRQTTFRQLERQLGDSEREWKQQLKQQEVVESDLEQKERRYLQEWRRGLVPAFRGSALREDDRDALIHHSRSVIRAFRDAYAQHTPEQLSNRVWNVFHETRQFLHDFVPEVEEDGGRLLIQFHRNRQHPQSPDTLLHELQEQEEEQELLLREKDRELYEQVLIHSVGRAIRDKIYRAEAWVKQMNELMQRRQTSSGLRLRLRWQPLSAGSEDEMDTAELVQLLRTDAQYLREEQLDRMVTHFRSRVNWARHEAEQHDTLRKWIYEILDYRRWFRFTLYFEKGTQNWRELTDARFNVLSGGEKAMSMYIPLFAATYSRYMSSHEQAPKLICLDEAFAGVDEENLRDMFELLTDMAFDYVMTSQVLWGCYDTVPSLSIYELIRPKDADFVTLIRFAWNGKRRTMLDLDAEAEPSLV